MQAIETKVIPATNFKGTRIKATCARGSVTIGYPHECNFEQAHIAAVKALVAKFCKEDFAKYGSDQVKNPWNTPFVTGQLASGNFAHVFIS